MRKTITLLAIGLVWLFSVCGLVMADELRGQYWLDVIHGRVTQPPYPIIKLNPAAAAISADTLPGSVVAKIIVRMSDGSAFAGSLGFGPPSYDNNGAFVISGRDLILSPANAGLSVGSTQNVTITATQ